jgi:uncharacterized membrane protein
MARALAEPLIFFTIPFVLYVAFLLLQLINPFAIDRWTRRVVLPLMLVGVALAVGSVALVGLMAPRYEGGYVPAHIENGRLLPGHMQ